MWTPPCFKKPSSATKICCINMCVWCCVPTIILQLLLSRLVLLFLQKTNNIRRRKILKKRKSNVEFALNGMLLLLSIYSP